MSTPAPEIPNPNPTLLEQAQKAAQDALLKAQGLATKAQESSAPYLQKAQEAATPFIQQAQAGINQAGTQAKGLFEQKVQKPGEEAAAHTSAAGSELADGLQEKTDAAAKEGSTDIEKAKNYLAGLTKNVTTLATNATTQLDAATKTDSHPGVVTQLGNAFTSAQGFLSSHLGTAAPSEPVGTAIFDASNDKKEEESIKEGLAELAKKDGELALGNSKPL